MSKKFTCPNDPEHDKFYYRVDGYQYMDADGTLTDQDLDDSGSQVKCDECGAAAIRED